MQNKYSFHNHQFLAQLLQAYTANSALHIEHIYVDKNPENGSNNRYERALSRCLVLFLFLIFAKQ